MYMKTTILNLFFFLLIRWKLRLNKRFIAWSSNNYNRNAWRLKMIMGKFYQTKIPYISRWHHDCSLKIIISLSQLLLKISKHKNFLLQAVWLRTSWRETRAVFPLVSSTAGSTSFTQVTHMWTWEDGERVMSSWMDTILDAIGAVKGHRSVWQKS